MTDNTHERLFDLISQVAAAQRLNRAYSSGITEHTAIDDRWLSDLLDRLNRIALALDEPQAEERKEGQRTAILDTLERLKSVYISPGADDQVLPRIRFERWHIDLDDVVEVLASLDA